ncbi:MAG: GntR family transcriptional regulator [Nocardioidaceae bacterium]
MGLRDLLAATVATSTTATMVRQLAADLGLAANTVARAYRELEADGVISTHGRRATFVRSTLLDTACRWLRRPDSSRPPRPRLGPNYRLTQGNRSAASRVNSAP